MKPGVGSKAVEVAVVFKPAFLFQPGANRPFQRGKCFFQVSCQGKDAAGIVEQHGVVGIEGKRPLKPLEAFIGFAERHKPVGPEVIPPGVAWVQAEVVFGNSNSALAGLHRLLGQPQVGVNLSGQ